MVVGEDEYSMYVEERDELFKVWPLLEKLSLNVGSEVAHMWTSDSSSSDG